MVAVSDFDVEQVEATARLHARRLGLRPRTCLRYYDAWDPFRTEAVGLSLIVARRASELRGMCARGRKPGDRLVWVAPHSTREAFLDTLTHEIAHAFTPWRERHSARWRDLHTATLAEVTSPAYADAVREVCALQYGLTA